ncbi:MAG: divergent PAP2 family protein [bacterium]|nr:divergent PAP2 family protein [bacterium]
MPWTVPVWVLVLACGLCGQLIKAAAYCAIQRRFSAVVLVQSVGLPSLPAAVLACLVTLMTMNHGWGSPEAGFALVFAVIGIHDSLKLGGASRRHQEALFAIVDHLQAEDRFPNLAVSYLDPRTHHPLHMVLGAVLGGLFALAFGGASG